ncbi:MAG: type III pantothenate kinase [Dehalococcoidales bacterium]|nr:type III pantothenate kinase [Dehalococcoidales bacterium]
MLLAVDIGNTETTLGVFEGDKLRATWHISTVISRTADELAPLLFNLLGNKDLQSSDINEVSFCSVVPPLTATFEEVFRRYFNISPMVVAAGIKTGVRICMDNPIEVGADRIVNAAAVHHLYGGPVIIVDLGTATTFDTVSEKGDYMGGAIAPGMVAATEAMFQKAAMLPRVELMRPNRAIGTNTIDAMKSGIVFGYVGLVEGMVARIQRELGVRTKVIATGGYARLIAGETSVIDEVNPDLTLIGLRLIYRMNKS